MSKFVELTDYDASIHRDILDALVREDETVIEVCEDRAIAEMRCYLSKRYDCNKIFEATGENRNQLVLMMVIDMAVYHIFCIHNPQKLSQVRKDRYERAVEWMKAVADEDISIEGAPLLPEEAKGGRSDSAFKATANERTTGKSKHHEKEKQKNNKAGIITVGGISPAGTEEPNVIVLTQPKRFGLDISDYMAAVRAAENVDFSRRYKLYDLYEDILMDTHLSCVLEKRKNAVLCSNMEFRVDGKPDDKINEQIQSPWFNRLVGDILDAKFWGFSLCQFYKLQEWVDYDLVPRKHVDPVRELILRHQTDITGHSWDEYTDLLFVGSPSDLGLLAKAAPWVIYKRNTTGDWAQFSEVFGMPIQEYIYDSDDDESRQRAMEDAANAGSLAQFFHAKDTELKLTEAGNKTGSADVYERLCERCNNEISKLILGNTLTTESSEKGTQALGTVHKKGGGQGAGG